VLAEELTEVDAVFLRQNLLLLLVGLAVPGVAVAVYFAIALFLVIPWRQVARLGGSAAAGAG
jgi:hypothetical protein